MNRSGANDYASTAAQRLGEFRAYPKMLLILNHWWSAQKTKKQIFLSMDVPQMAPKLALEAEKRVFIALKELEDK